MLRTLKKAEELAGIALFCVILLSILWQVVARYFFNAPPSWTEELSRLLFIYMGTIGVHLAQGDYAHVRIDMLVTGASPRFRRGLELLILVVSGTAMGALAWFSLLMTVRKAPIHLVSLSVSSAFMYVNAFLVSFLALASMIRQAAAILRGRESEVYQATPASREV